MYIIIFRNEAYPVMTRKPLTKNNITYKVMIKLILLTYAVKYTDS